MAQWTPRVNDDLNGRSVLVRLRDGTRIDVRGVHVEGRIISWLDRQTQQVQTIALDRVREVSFISRRRGALDGAIIGGTIGAPAGLLVSDSGPGAGDRAAAAGAGAVSVSLWTIPIGAIKGSRLVYRFE